MGNAIVEAMMLLLGLEDPTVKSPLLKAPQPGQPNGAIPQIKRTITRIIKEGGYKEIYVGLASFSDIGGYDSGKNLGEFEVGSVVYRTKNWPYARRVEKAIIQHYQKKGIVKVLSDEGSSRRKGEPPYYVFVVFR